MRRNKIVKVNDYHSFGRINRTLPDGQFEVYCQPWMPAFICYAHDLELVIPRNISPRLGSWGTYHRSRDFSPKRSVPSLRKFKMKASMYQTDVWKKKKFRQLVSCPDLPYLTLFDHMWKIKRDGRDHRGYGHNIFKAWTCHDMVLTTYRAKHKAFNITGPNWEININHEAVELVRGSSRDVICDFSILMLG